MAELARAEAALMALGSTSTRRSLRRRSTAKIRKVNVRLGQFAQQSLQGEPLMTMGVVDPLHFCVDIERDGCATGRQEQSRHGTVFPALAR